MNGCNSAYLDNNATTAIHPEVAAVMAECYAVGYLNPASQHAVGRQARRVLEQARQRIGQLLGVRSTGPHPDRVVFTSGGTEANNLALRGISQSQKRQKHSTRVVVSAVEHPSLAETAGLLAQDGFDVQRLHVDREGVVSLDHLHELLNEPTICVSVMLGNNETGVLQPLDAIVEICRRQDVPVHTDAVQVVGKLPVSFAQLNVDALTATAHKFHGPKGIGVLLVRHGLDIMPVITGGSQQLGTRPGTESVALAVGMCRALEIWEREARVRAIRMRELRDLLQSELCSALPQIIINGGGADRLPHTLNVSFPGLDRQAIFMALDHAGVYCSTGSACTSGSSEPSPVLLAMGSSSAVVGGSLRFSVSAHTTVGEVEFAVAKIVKICRHFGTFAPP